MEELKNYLMTRLLVMMACVGAAEMLVRIPIRQVIIPAAMSLVSIEPSIQELSPEQILALLINSLFGRGRAALLDTILRSRAAGLLTLALLLMITPVAAGILVYTRLVTKKVDELQRQRDDERQAFEAKRNLLLSDIAHDLRTPITTISGYAGALQEGLITDPATRSEYIEAIRSKSVRMSELMNMLFEYLKLGSADYQLNREPCNLNELIAETTAQIYSDAEEAGMMLEADIPEEPFTVLTDKAQADRIFYNLLINAVRHNERGTKIAVIVRRRAGTEWIAVADTGKKIEGAAEKLFDPFVRGDSARSSGTGSGLGLSIARSVADMHGWELTLVQPWEDYTKAFIMKVPELA